MNAVRPSVVVSLLLVAGCASAPPEQAKDPAPPVAASPAPTPAPAPPPPAPAAPPPPAPVQPAPPPPALAVVAPPAPAPKEKLAIKTSLANLREAPGNKAKIIGVLKQGTRLEVLEERDQWFRVRVEDGREGWVAESVTSAPAR
jgi:uncharacterized protein YgiM (DUF1202 family)